MWSRNLKACSRAISEPAGVTCCLERCAGAESVEAEPSAGRGYWLGGMWVARYRIALKDVPADFFADPDGQWQLESLARVAGFEGRQDVAVGALTRRFRGHPEGSAVVTLNAKARPYVAIVECPAVVSASEETAA